MKNYNSLPRISLFLCMLAFWVSACNSLNDPNLGQYPYKTESGLILSKSTKIHSSDDAKAILMRQDAVWDEGYRMYCFSQKPNLESAVKIAARIFKGRVVKRALNYEHSPVQLHSCFVLLKVEEVFKGDASQYMWVNSYYYNRYYPDPKNIENCQYTVGKDYLVFGSKIGLYLDGHRTTSTGMLASDPAIAAKNHELKEAGAGEGFFCYPSEVYPNAQPTEDALRKMLKH